MRYVKYIGPAHERQITATDWRRAGINGETVVWSAYNGFAVPADQFTDQQMNRAIYPDPFLVVTGDEDFAPKPQTRAMTPDQLTAETENPVDVVAYLNGDDNVSTGELAASDK